MAWHPPDGWLSLLLGVSNVLARLELAALRESAAKHPSMTEFIESPNRTNGRYFQKVTRIVVHSMAGTMQGSIATFKDSASKVSAHILVGHDGRLVQMVKLADAAWHAGSKPLLFGMSLDNLTTIGIEHEGGTFPDGHTDMLGEAGYAASASLIADLHRTYGWGTPSERTVVPHRALKATACPSGLDVAKLIAMAQQAYAPAAVSVPVQQDQDVTPVPESAVIKVSVATIADAPPVPFVTFSPARTIKVTSPKGAYVRTEPKVDPRNIYAAKPSFDHGDAFFCQGAVHGEAPAGSPNDVWMLTQGGRYVWSGTTEFTYNQSA